MHITYQWPNKIYANSGIFIYQTLEQLVKYCEHNFSVLMVNKLINKEYIKEKNFTAKNYFNFLYRKDQYFKSLSKINFIRKCYPPLLGLPKAKGYNALIAWQFIRISVLRYIKKNKITLLQAHYSNPDGYIAFKVKEKLGIPYIMNIHGADVQEYQKLTLKEKWLIKKVYSNADMVICNSTKTQKLFYQLFDSSIPTKVIAFGIDFKSSPRKSVELNNPVKILSVGNLVQIKGIQYVIDALGKLDKHNFIYHIIGDGPMMNSLKEQVTAYNLKDKVVFHGRQNHDFVIDYMSNSDIFVLPSYNEAFGVVYLEALASGCAVIGVKGQGCEDINSKKECIYLVEPQNTESIVNAINKIVSDDEKRLEMRRNGYEVVEKYYDWEKLIEEYKLIYDNLS